MLLYHPARRPPLHFCLPGPRFLLGPGPRLLMKVKKAPLGLFRGVGTGGWVNDQVKGATMVVGVAVCSAIQPSNGFAPPPSRRRRIESTLGGQARGQVMNYLSKLIAALRMSCRALDGHSGHNPGQYSTLPHFLAYASSGGHAIPTHASPRVRVHKGRLWRQWFAIASLPRAHPLSPPPPRPAPTPPTHSSLPPPSETAHPARPATRRPGRLRLLSPPSPFPGVVWLVPPTPRTLCLLASCPTRPAPPDPCTHPHPCPGPPPSPSPPHTPTHPPTPPAPP